MKVWISLMFVFVAAGVYAEDQQAITDTGRAVILKDDGTWSYADGSTRSVQKVVARVNHKKFVKPKDATFQVKSLKNSSSVWINPLKWSFKKKNADNPAEYIFKSRDKDLYAMLIPEGIAMSVEALADIALVNAKKAAPDAKIIKKEYRNVNGQKVIYMEMRGSIKGINFVYRGYYHSSKKGSTQLVVYTGANLVDKYKDDIDELLNGLDIR